MKQVLIVDDSSVIRKVAKRILENMKMETLEAEDGQKALAICSTSMPDASCSTGTCRSWTGTNF